MGARQGRSRNRLPQRESSLLVRSRSDHARVGKPEGNGSNTAAYQPGHSCGTARAISNQRHIRHQRASNRHDARRPGRPDVNTTTAESQLFWFFNRSASEMGICSSFMALRAAIMSGGSSRTSMQDSMTDKRIEATHRNRQILTRLSRLPQKHIDTLYAAYASRCWGDALEAAFGRAVGVCALSPAARRYYDDDVGYTTDGFWAWLLSVVLRGETERIAEIRVEASDMLRAAVRAYAG